MAVADKFSNEPIVFIAVNSGNDAKEVNKYVRANGVTWPVIIDLDRTFESKTDVNEISLSNIWQFRSIDAKGNLEHFSGKNIETTAQKLLDSAQWEVDPALIPASLAQAHRLIEFGSFAAAAKTLNRASKSSDDQIKTGATALLDYVNEQIAAQIKQAEEALQNEEHWQAYKIFKETEDQFGDYKIDFDLRAALKELKGEEKVKNEFAAQRQFLSAKRSFSRSGAKRTLVKLKTIVEKYPDTEAAALSAEAIDTLEKAKR